LNRFFEKLNMSGREHEGSELTEEERQRMHEAYSEMGKKGGKVGGETRKQQMAQTGTPYTKSHAEGEGEQQATEEERGEQ
jgi:hypothetical protein